MMIIICGLPGTGKTTLCKKIAQELNFKYINDWQIFNQNNITIDNLQDKIEISSNYSGIIFDYLKHNQNKNIVVDLEYSVSPQDFVCHNNTNKNQIIYLGFVSVEEELLLKLFKQSSKDENITDIELKRQIKFYKQMSKLYYNQCKQLNLQFVDIDRDRKVILEQLYNNIKNQN